MKNPKLPKLDPKQPIRPPYGCVVRPEWKIYNPPVKPVPQEGSNE